MLEAINEAASLDELLLRFLRMLKEMLDGRAATIRLVTPGGNGGSRINPPAGISNPGAISMTTESPARYRM